MVSRHLRSLSKAPAFSLLIVLTLALGIGATTALFSVVDAVLLQPLAFPDSGRIVAIHTSWPEKDRVTPRITGGDFLDLKSRLHSFSDMSFYNGGQVGVQLGRQAQFAWAFQADPAFFRVLNVSPAMGRLPRDSDANQSAVLTSSFARANWGAASSALGQLVTIDNKPYSVIGIVEDRFAFPEKAELWIIGPTLPQNRNRSAFNYYAVGRLRPGVALAQAQAETSTVSVALAAAEPASNQGKTFRVLSLQEDLTGPTRTTLLFLFGSAGLLLCISCANAANLMLARAAARVREIAVRISLGASTFGIVQMLLAEGALLGCVAAALGLLLGRLSVQAMSSIISATLPRGADAVHIHPSVLLFAAALSCLTVTVCSVLPALHLRKVNIAEVLKRSPGRGYVSGGTRARQLIVVAQIALCCILCVGAALLARAFLALVDTPVGYLPENVLVMYADAPAFELPEYLQAIRTFETALDKIRHTAGVRSAAAVMGLPTGRYGSNGSYLVEGIHIQPGEDPFKTDRIRDLPEATFALASPHYFETVGIRLIAGRDFNLRDQFAAPFTAIVSQALARQSFGSSDPIGRRIYCGLDSPKPMTIVGVVSDVRRQAPASKPEPEIYMPFQQHPSFANELQVVVRTYADPTLLAPGLRKLMHTLAPAMATSFTTFSEMVRDANSASRFRATLALAFAILAVVLAMTGVYSVTAYFVGERQAELGLRMALGANRTSIAGFVLRRTLSLAAAGLTIGIAGAVVVGQVVAGSLFGVPAVGVTTYCIGAGTVLFVMIVASSIPTWRASRVDPAAVLKNG